MTTPTFSQNLRRLPALFSTWVVFLLTTLAGFWITLPAEEQALIQAEFPFVKYVVLVGSFAAFAVARAAPQPPKEMPSVPPPQS